jgi:hypothetical protein
VHSALSGLAMLSVRLMPIRTQRFNHLPPRRRLQVLLTVVLRCLSDASVTICELPLSMVRLAR